MVKRTDSNNITIVLTIEECNVFNSLCTQFLGNFKFRLSRNRALALNKILDKIEEARK